MKILLYILACFLIATSGSLAQVSPANPATPAIGVVAATPSLFAEDWENIADGEEWSNDGNWTELSASTNVFVGDDAQANGGSLSGLMAAGINDSNIITDTFSPAGQYVHTTIYVRMDDATPGTLHEFFFFCHTDCSAAGNVVGELYNHADGSMYLCGGGGFVDSGFDFSDDTWHKVEIETDITNDKHSYWFDDGAYGSNPVNSCFNRDLSAWDTLRLKTDQDGASIWVDDLVIVDGQR